MNEENRKWVKGVYERIIEKSSKVVRRSGEKIPYTTENGVFEDKFAKDPTWWTNGFWIGIVWLMYAETKDEYYKELANKLEKRMDGALYGTFKGTQERPDPNGGIVKGIDGLHHDVGFQWLLCAVANYRLTGNEDSRTRGLIAANYLMARFNFEAGFLTAWNGNAREGWSIIDSMMNIPLLYWATQETGRTRYARVGRAHADKTLQNAIRPDGSVIHIIEYDVNDGSVVATQGGQGFGVGSSWTRGQTWAMYGFALSYRYTNEQRYLDAAKRVANYFIAAVADNGYVPPVDFRSPKEPALVDTTAGAVAACGLIEIAAHVGEFERDMYFNAALKILKAIEEKYADWTDGCDAILRCGTSAYHDVPGRHMDIIYGDYYFMEAIFKLNGLDINLW